MTDDICRIDDDAAACPIAAGDRCCDVNKPDGRAAIAKRRMAPVAPPVMEESILFFFKYD